MLRLRGIAVSTRAALRGHPQDATRIRTAAKSLLEQLEADIEAEGDSEGVLADLAAVRRELLFDQDEG